MSKHRSEKKMLSLEQLAQAAGEIAEHAESEHVDVALIGGYALQLYGSPRLTGDVDVVVDRPIEALTPESSLSFGGYRSTTDGGVPVDVVLRDDDFRGLYEAALRDAEDFDQVPVRVVGSEYIAAMKMAAGRARDSTDLEFLISKQVIDRVKTRLIVHRYLGPYAAKEFDALVSEIEWKVSRGMLE